MLEPGPSGMEGKHLWGCLDHAVAFGRLVQRRYEPSAFHVLEVHFDPAAKVACYNPGRHDGIGPAYFADEDAMRLVASIRAVTIEPFEPEEAQ